MSPNMLAFFRYLKNKNRAGMTTVWRSFQTENSHYFIDSEGSSNTFDTKLHSHPNESLSLDDASSIILSLCLLLEQLLSTLSSTGWAWPDSIALTSAFLGLKTSFSLFLSFLSLNY